MGIREAGSRIFSHAIVGVTSLTALFSGVATVRAEVLNSCTTYCHGMPPRDSASRKASPHFNAQSSAFPGNHQTHVKAVPAASDCSVCHKPVAPTNFSHQDNVIQMANSLKGYSTATRRAKYNKGVFFNQTSIPNMTNATCSSVNCHFENTTPAWGSASYVSPAGCAACHGAPPAGGVTGTAGSHARHNTYYTGTANCQKCHPNSISFIHATSAGRPLKVQGFLRNPLNVLESGATYSGTGLNYLPSQSGAQLFGSCANLYCHSTVQNATNGTTAGVTYRSLAWGGAPLSCAGCHVDEATDATGTGGHRVHTTATGANIDCGACHAGYTKTTITTATHVNGLIELGATGFTYSQGSGAANPAGNGYGTCSTSVCHGSATVTWGASTSNVTCTKCHGKGSLLANYSSASAVQSAPGYGGTGTDLAGQAGTITNGVSNDPQVGAHDAHLRAVNGYTTRNVLCSDCHTVPTSGAHATGVTDITWSNFAKNIGTAGTPSTRGALTPAYSGGACSANYCHGGRLAGGANTAPAWNGTTYLTPYAKTAANCGKCHGAPPQSAPSSYLHPGLTVTGDCAGCHGHNGSGSTHIDGTLQAAGGGCSGCHDYDTTGGGTTWGTTNFGGTVAMEGRGAHAKHIEYIKSRYGVTLNAASDTFGTGNAAAVCGVCHTNLGANHAMGDSTQPRSINFGDGSTTHQLGAGSPLYSGIYNTSSAVNQKTCSNLDCHYKTTPLWSTY